MKDKTRTVTLYVLDVEQKCEAVKNMNSRAIVGRLF